MGLKKLTSLWVPESDMIGLTGMSVNRILLLVTFLELDIPTEISKMQ